MTSPTRHRSPLIIFLLAPFWSSFFFEKEQLICVWVGGGGGGGGVGKCIRRVPANRTGPRPKAERGAAAEGVWGTLPPVGGAGWGLPIIMSRT